MNRSYQAMLQTLDCRRRELRMSVTAIAKRSAVSLPTVARILSGRFPYASFANVAAIADALGMVLKLESVMDADDFREDQAQRKARQLVAMVQGTSALEAQAVDDRTLDAMTRQTVHELLTGSPRALWSE